MHIWFRFSFHIYTKNVYLEYFIELIYYLKIQSQSLSILPLSANVIWLLVSNVIKVQPVTI